MHTIFYYSGTGNSMYVALELASRTNAETSAILQENEMNLEGDVGIVFPIYMNNLPKPVEKFIRKSDFSKVTYLYVVTTNSGIPGKPEHYLHRLFSEKNSLLEEYHAITMINNTPKGVAPKMFMHMNWEEEITSEKVSDMLRSTGEDIENIAAKINRRTTDFLTNRTNPKNQPTLFDKALWRIKSSPKLSFTVDQSCIGCGICEKVCLTQRIRMEDMPKWVKDECYYCYACFNFCPVQAISVKHYDKKKGRYHHPNITAEQIASQKINDDE